MLATEVDLSKTVQVGVGVEALGKIRIKDGKFSSDSTAPVVTFILIFYFIAFIKHSGETHHGNVPTER